MSTPCMHSLAAPCKRCHPHLPALGPLTYLPCLPFAPPRLLACSGALPRAPAGCGGCAPGCARPAGQDDNGSHRPHSIWVRHAVLLRRAVPCCCALATGKRVCAAAGCTALQFMPDCLLLHPPAATAALCLPGACHVPIRLTRAYLPAWCLLVCCRSGWLRRQRSWSGWKRRQRR